VAQVRERLAVNKQSSHRLHMQRINLRKLYEVESKAKYQLEVSNRFADLEDLYTEVVINGAWEMIRENIKISAKHKLWLHEECSKLSDQSKQAKLQ
jgi:exonuclease III